MLQYIFITTGRNQWINLALSLINQKIANPTFWYGNKALNIKAERFLKNTRFLDTEEMDNKIIKHPINIDTEKIKTIYDPFLLEVKERAFKMMDRFDPTGSFKRVDREAFINYYILYSIELIKDTSPDFLLTTDIPHTPFSYLLLEIANLKKIPIYSFYSCSLAPIIFLKRGIYGENLSKPANHITKIPEAVHNQVIDYLDKFKKENTDIEPRYIKLQKISDDQNSKLYIKLKNILRPYKKALTGDTTKSSNRPLLGNTKIKRLEPILSDILINNRKRELNKSLEEVIDCEFDLQSEYIYFPLHYEPERTTNPDGIKYHDQFRALITLRSLTPQGISIAVKEHSSQFTSQLFGYKGRSPYFYELLKIINGITLIDPSIPSKNLIKNSIFTATITGTAALESALMGKPALIFGNVWFENCPGISKFFENITFDEIIKGKPKNLNDVENWIINKINIEGFFGALNMSSEIYHSPHFNSLSLKNELEGIVENLIYHIKTDLNIH